MSWKAGGSATPCGTSYNTAMGYQYLGGPNGSFWEDFHAFLARSSATCALRRGGGVGLRDDRCRCPRRPWRKLRQPRLANLFGAAIGDSVAGRAPDRLPHGAYTPGRRAVRT